jgi:uncharacterized protein
MAQKPIVDFLKLPDDGAPYLAGVRCGACGATYLGEKRLACARCTERKLAPVKLTDRGKLWVYSIVHQSVPGVKTPYVAAIVDLDDGVSVRCNVVDVEPDPAKIPFGLPVQMVTRVAGQDGDGNDVVAFYFRPS